jgi:hypothetical protein
MSKRELPELPAYECHKKVKAAKIVSVNPSGCDSKPCKMTVEVDGAEHELDVQVAYMLKHQPQAGGYFVVYQDGYESYSPASAFENGYTRAEKKPHKIATPL